MDFLKKIVEENTRYGCLFLMRASFYGIDWATILLRHSSGPL